VNGITAEELMDCLETAGSRHDAAVLDRLWSSVPAEMRLPRLSAGTVSALYQGGFAEGGQRGTAIDVSGLPGPMRREVTWCVFRVIELGGRIQVHGAAMLARRLTEITAGTGAGGPQSLTDLTARAWCCASLKMPMKAALAVPMWGCVKAPRPGWLRGLGGDGAGGCGRGAGGYVSVTSVTAARAACSSTMALPVA
jgi:hypothetical protein